ncbi:MAG: SIS domain-containing protein [Chthoniobacterales bacterium]
MTRFKTSLQAAVETLQATGSLEEKVVEVAELVGRALLDGRKLLLCGNGGSAADAAHIATEFVCRFKEDRKGYPAMALTVDGGLMTAVGNDYEFQEIFARQVQAFGGKGDVLIVISTSGKSRNLLDALEEGRRQGMSTVALLGRTGGFTKGAAELEVIVEGEDTARIQEAQKFLLHVICEMVEEKLQKS